MPERIPQSVALRVSFDAYLSVDGTEATGKTIPITISKNGAAFGNPNAGATNATEIGNGSYYVDLDTTDSGTLGPLVVRWALSGIDPGKDHFRVVKATTAGFSALPDAVPGASGGLPTTDASNGVTLKDDAITAAKIAADAIGAAELATDAVTEIAAAVTAAATATPLAVDVKKVNGSTTAAAQLALNAASGQSFVVTGTPTTTRIATNLTATADLSGRLIRFTSGVLAGEEAVIASYDGAGTVTVPELSDAPTAGDTGVLP